MRSRFPLCILAALSLGADCQDVKDIATGTALIADYKYHEICQTCCHHDWKLIQVTVTPATAVNPKVLCRNHYQCTRCGEAVEGPEIPCLGTGPGQYGVVK